MFEGVLVIAYFREFEIFNNDFQKMSIRIKQNIPKVNTYCQIASYITVFLETLYTTNLRKTMCIIKK